MRQALGPDALGKRERVEREVGGGIRMGNTCKPMAVSFQCMTKSTPKKKEEWPSSKSLQTINAGESVKKRECSCTVGGNIN